MECLGSYHKRLKRGFYSRTISGSRMLIMCEADLEIELVRLKAATDDAWTRVEREAARAQAQGLVTFDAILMDASAAYIDALDLYNSAEDELRVAHLTSTAATLVNY